MPSKLTEKREELTAKQKFVSDIFAEAGEDLDFEKVTLIEGNTTDKVKKLQELNTELETLAREVHRLNLEHMHDTVQQIGEDLKGAPAQPGTYTHPPAERDREPSGLGDLFVKSIAYQSYKKNKGNKGQVATLDVELKTLFQTSAGWDPFDPRIGRVVDAVTRPIQLLQLIPVGQTDSSTIKYMEETTRTHASAEKAEGVAYAESTFALTEQSSEVRKITDSIPVTDEQLDDEAQVRSYLDNRLRFGVRQRLDNQVINGDGVAPNLLGILNVAGIQTQAKGADPTFDAVHKAMTKCRLTGRSFPNALVFHHNDWQDIRLTRTADGIYILGNPAVPGPMQLFGLPVTLSDAIAEGTGLVGDFQNFSQLFNRKGIDVQIGFVGTQFTEGKITLRADLRAAFVVYRPAAFCTVTGI